MLEDGWSPAAPEGDTLLRGYVTGFAAMITAIGQAKGTRVLETDDVVALDIGSDFLLANGAILRHPVRDDALPTIVDELRDFFAPSGVAWVLVSAWPTPSLEGMALIGHPPFMVRPAGGTPPPDPDGLVVRKVTTAAEMADWARALEGYPASGTDAFADERLLEVPGMHFWVGYLDGQPVACSGAHVTDACNDVEYVACHEVARGRGIGAALTWRATLADPTKPAVLIASDPGQPVYEKMGYLRVTRLTMWAGAAAPA